jgi:hypothetical protein
VRIAAIVAVVVGITAGVLAYAARGEARDRCETSAPPFPHRVIAIDVDWQPLSLGYECVYTLRYGATIRLDPCPEGLWRQPGLARCGPRRPP